MIRLMLSVFQSIIHAQLNVSRITSPGENFSHMLGGVLAEQITMMTKVLTYFETGLRPNECISDSRISSPSVPCRPLLLRPRGVHHNACIAL